jgi:hypothetical protein
MRRAATLAVTLCSAALVAGCAPTPPGTPKPIALAPVCTIQAVFLNSNPTSSGVLVFERTDPSRDHGFRRFRGIAGPRGNSALGFTSDVYGYSEAWLRNPAAPEVHRAQVSPALARGAATPTSPRPSDFKGSAWSLQAQDARGAWSPVFATSRNRTEDRTADRAAAGREVPQLMPVGLATPQMFACAGELTEDEHERTTWLVESVAPNAARGVTGGAMFIQDLLNGDDRFVPNARGILVGPANPPKPAVSGPGHPIRRGPVKCAMRQVDDNLATRELHMLAIENGVLYHAMASNWGPVTSGSGSTFSRFRTVSPWGDVGQALGGGFGTIVSAAVVADRPNTVSVLFVAQSGGRYRLWRAVRFSTGGGSWRAADDVMRLSGDWPAGHVEPWQVAAGTCPAMGATAWTDQNTELVIALWGREDFEVLVVRALSTPVQWRPTVNGIYSPLGVLGNLSTSSDAAARNFTAPSLIVTARPFPDNAVPPP